MKKELKNHYGLVRRFSDGLVGHNISAHAASGAFYMFLSLVPFIAAVTALIPYTHLTSQELLGLIDEYIPEALMQIINDIVNEIYIASDTVLPISIIVSIWLASRAFSSLIRGIENIADTPHYASFFKRSLRALLYTVVLLGALITLPTFIALSERMFEYIKFSKVLVVIHKLRYPFVAIFLTLVLMAVYHFTPNVKLKFMQLLPGAAAAAIVWLLFSWLFSLYMRYFGDYSVYGSLATIVISLLWMYWCMYIILLGAYLDIYLVRRKEADGEIY